MPNARYLEREEDHHDGGKEGCRGQAGREVCASGISTETAGEFREFVHGQVRNLMVEVMREEIEILCGPRHRPTPGVEYFRAGSAPGYVLHEGRRQDVVRPRMRRREGDGSVEAPLSTYANAQDPEELRQRVLEAFQAGAGSREQERLHGDSTPGVSKSEVSRLWRREGEKVLAEFRARDIARKDWLVLMLDGIHLERDQMAVVALGVAEDDTKHLLDFCVCVMPRT